MPNAADTAMQFALSQVGHAYCMGGTGPGCYDCSGLIQTAYGKAGVKLPRTTFQQMTVGNPIGKADLAPGDLVFPDPGHVQLYLGNGQQVEAANPRTGVITRGLWGFQTARRVTTPGGVAALGNLNAAGTGNTGCAALAATSGGLFIATTVSVWQRHRKIPPNRFP